jgi:F-type H+-transporting ATPase subunit epsilon
VEIKILSLNKKIYEGKVKTVTLPGKEGQFQILDNHADLFALLDRGEVIVGKAKKIPILSGIVEVLENKVTILIK